MKIKYKEVAKLTKSINTSPHSHRQMRKRCEYKIRNAMALEGVQFPVNQKDTKVRFFFLANYIDLKGEWYNVGKGSGKQVF